jgi:penicillin V acylase-like amidase (Ntn superfamily)
MFQLGYELSDACTSIIMKSSNGQIYHARNLDFGAGMGFSDTLKNATIQV